MSRRFLLITPVLPWPLRRNGGAQRTALMVRALKRHGEVDILGVGGPEIREDEPDFDARLAQHGVVACLVRERRAARVPFYAIGPIGSLLRSVRGWTSRYERDERVVQLVEKLRRERQYAAVVSRYLAPALQSGIDRMSVPRFLDFDDIDFSTFEAHVRSKPWKGLTGPMAARRVLKSLRSTCQNAVQRFDAVFVTSEEDRTLLSHKTTVLPNIPFSEEGSIVALAPVDDSRELLFVGDLQFPPNRDGLDHFLTRVWPAVRAKVTDATITIVGRGLTDDRRARWGAIAGTNVVGFAPDLVDCYRRCCASVVPLYFGGGTKIKILESLAFGRTVVTTTHAMRGYASLNGQHPAVAVTGSDEDFADACVRLLTTSGLRNAMARRGTEIVERDYSFERFASIVDQALSGVLG